MGHMRKKTCALWGSHNDKSSPRSKAKWVGIPRFLGWCPRSSVWMIHVHMKYIKILHVIGVVLPIYHRTFANMITYRYIQRIYIHIYVYIYTIYIYNHQHVNSINISMSLPVSSRRTCRPVKSTA